MQVFRIKVTFFEKHAERILLFPRKALGPLAGTFGRDREEDGGRETEDRKREAGPLAAGDRTLASPLNSRDFFLILEERILPS